MTLETLISRLEGVRKTGPDRWIARAPTRADKHPSVSIRELPDGRILMHDFGGDATLEILEAVGLDMTVLFPDRPALGMFHTHRTERRPFATIDVIRCLAFEISVVLDISRQMRRGEGLSDVDQARLVTACGRVVAAMDIANG